MWGPSKFIVMVLLGLLGDTGLLQSLKDVFLGFVVWIYVVQTFSISLQSSIFTCYY